jgi:hypothetical protein
MDETVPATGNEPAGSSVAPDPPRADPDDDRSGGSRHIPGTGEEELLPAPTGGNGSIGRGINARLARELGSSHLVWA